ncbi:MAG TPA: CoA-binding protein [Bacillales bacterium]|nr:CoA-binding protein [Bacillales bacterium]
MAIENPDRDELKRILSNNRRIAVVGLSDQPERSSYGVAKAMKAAGYEIIPVNPNIDATLGIQAVDSLEAIEGHVDIVNVFRRSEHLPDLAAQTVKIGADVFWAQPGVTHEEAYDYLKANGVKVIMDRCIKVEHSMTGASPHPHG